MLMLKMRTYLGFAQKAGTRSDIVYKIGADDFDSYFPAKSSQLVSQIDFSHPPHIYTFHQFIIAKACSRCLFHSYSRLFCHMYAFARFCLQALSLIDEDYRTFVKFCWSYKTK